MIGYLLVLLSIPFKYLFVSGLYATVYLLSFVSSVVFTLNYKEILSISYIMHIYCIKSTLTQRQIINSIQYIGFPNTIITDKTINLWTKLQRCLFIILKIQ